MSSYEGLLRLTIHGAKGLKAVNVSGALQQHARTHMHTPLHARLLRAPAPCLPAGCLPAALSHAQRAHASTHTHARARAPAQITGGSDPYVVASLGDSAAATDVRWGELSPAWGSTHTLYVTCASTDVLKLRVIDKNKLISDVDLGTVMVPLPQLLATPGARLELPLRGACAPARAETRVHGRAACMHGRSGTDSWKRACGACSPLSTPTTCCAAAAACTHAHARAGGNAQGSVTVSAELLPFSSEVLDAAVAADTQVRLLHGCRGAPAPSST